MQSLFYRLIAAVVCVAALVLFVFYMKRASRDVHSQVVDDLKASASKEGMPDLPDLEKIRDNARKNPNSPEAQAALAHALFRHGQYAEALPVFDDAIRLNPSDAQLFFERAKIRDHGPAKPDVIADYEQAVFLDPKNVPAMLRAAHLWLLQRDTSRSIQWCRRALEVDPNNAAAHHLWGLSLAQQGDFSFAVNEYEAAVRSGGKDDSLLYNLGVAYKKTGDRRAARDAFSRACQANPRNTSACREGQLTGVD